MVSSSLELLKDFHRDNCDGKLFVIVEKYSFVSNSEIDYSDYFYTISKIDYLGAK